MHRIPHLLERDVGSRAGHRGARRASDLSCRCPRPLPARSSPPLGCSMSTCSVGVQDRRARLIRRRGVHPMDSGGPDPRERSRRTRARPGFSAAFLEKKGRARPRTAKTPVTALPSCGPPSCGMPSCRLPSCRVSSWSLPSCELSSWSLSSYGLPSRETPLGALDHHGLVIRKRSEGQDRKVIPPRAQRNP